MRMRSYLSIVAVTVAIASAGCAQNDQGRKADAKPAKQAKSGAAPAAVVELFGEKLVNSAKESVSVNGLAGKTIGVYFSAHWCPPCRGFTPKLVDFYNALQKDNKPFEIVFVSSDKSEDKMYGYMTETKMPWLALPYGDAHKKSLSQKYGVRGIPSFVILKPSGELITKGGRGEVTGKGPAAFDGWQ